MGVLNRFRVLLGVCALGGCNFLPDGSFDEFLQRFRSDQSFQVTRTALPVPVSTQYAWMTLSGERNASCTSERAAEWFTQLGYPIYPGKDLLQASRSVEILVTKAEDSVAVVVGPPNSEADAEYLFKKSYGQWRLVAIKYFGWAEPRDAANPCA